jgi:hypothetical protein
MHSMFISHHHNAGQNHNIKPCIRDVTRSNPGQNTDILTEGFPQSFQANVWIIH